MKLLSKQSTFNSLQNYIKFQLAQEVYKTDYSTSKITKIIFQ